MMGTLQEIVDLADSMQLRGDEKKDFIAEKRKKEREARLQAEEREREARLQMEERLKIEELKTQIEMEKIRSGAGIKSEGGATEETAGIYVRPKLPKLPAFIDNKERMV